MMPLNVLWFRDVGFIWNRKVTFPPHALGQSTQRKREQSRKDCSLRWGSGLGAGLGKPWPEPDRARLDAGRNGKWFHLILKCLSLGLLGFFDNQLLWCNVATTATVFQRTTVAVCSAVPVTSRDKWGDASPFQTDRLPVDCLFVLSWFTIVSNRTFTPQTNGCRCRLLETLQQRRPTGQENVGLQTSKGQEFPSVETFSCIRLQDANIAKRNWRPV